MDSRDVNRELRRRIRPQLREAGFSRFTARTAWRYDDLGIDVVNFQSFNSHLAESISCTTYSFSLNLGRYLHAVPGAVGPRPPRQKDGDLLPAEYECHFRGRLHRGFVQPELERRDTWYIDPEGRYLEPAMDDVSECLHSEGWAWFGRLHDPEEVLAILLGREAETDRLWGPGANPSPGRSLVTGYVARASGNHQLAAEKLREALDSGCFERARAVLEADVADSGRRAAPSSCD